MTDKAVGSVSSLFRQSSSLFNQVSCVMELDVITRRFCSTFSLSLLSFFKPGEAAVSSWVAHNKKDVGLGLFEVICMLGAEVHTGLVFFSG